MPCGRSDACQLQEASLVVERWSIDPMSGSCQAPAAERSKSSALPSLAAIPNIRRQWLAIASPAARSLSTRQ
jgi:hypothetical protein